MIFDLVIRSTWDILCNFSPFISVNFVSFNKYVVFILVPATFANTMIKVIVPSFSTLLSVSYRARDPLFELISDNIPLFSAKFFDKDINKYIFL